MTTKINMLSIFAIATILLTSTIVPNFVAYADNDDDDDDEKKPKITELQKKCQKDPRNPLKIKAECELLNTINSLQEDQATKNDQIDALIAALQAKDMALMDADSLLADKDVALDAKDMELMDTDAIMCQNTVHQTDAMASYMFWGGLLTEGLQDLSEVDLDFGISLPEVSVDVIKGVSYSTRMVDPCDEFNSIEDLIGWNPDCEIRIISGVHHSTQNVVLMEEQDTVNIQPFLFLEGFIELNMYTNAITELSEVEQCQGYEDTAYLGQLIDEYGS